MTTHILALDQGTTSSRSILFDAQGDVVAVAQREFTQHFPRSGWVEHDAQEIWATQAATITEVLARSRLTPANVAAIGITNQRETTVLWDRATGRPVAPALVWQDRRTADACAALKTAGHEAEVTRRTGLVLDPYFSATKLAWLLDSDATLRARAERGELAFGTIDSWLVWNLTGGAAHVSDITNASRTLLLNIKTGDWDPWLLELFRVPPAVLPRVVASCLAPGALPARIGGREIAIGGIAGDQQAALFGQACFEPGMAKNTYGTGCFLLMNTGPEPQFSSHRLLTTVAWDIGERCYALEGSVFTGGAVVQWLRDGLGIIESSSDVESLAAGVPDAGGVCLVPAFTGLGSPHWDPYARGAILGLSRGTTRAHVARAALESIAFQSAELLAAMQADARSPVRELRVDGGAARNDLLLQFQADLLGLPVVRPSNIETTAQGAANLAGLSVGLWRSTADLAANWRIDRRFEPAISRDAASAHMARWSRAVERARDWHREQA
jgi:glycerol kinase